jgi:hypothetical protein
MHCITFFIDAYWNKWSMSRPRWSLAYADFVVRLLK